MVIREYLKGLATSVYHYPSLVPPVSYWPNRLPDPSPPNDTDRIPGTFGALVGLIEASRSFPTLLADVGSAPPVKEVGTDVAPMSIAIAWNQAGDGYYHYLSADWGTPPTLPERTPIDPA